MSGNPDLVICDPRPLHEIVNRLMRRALARGGWIGKKIPCFMMMSVWEVFAFHLEGMLSSLVR